MIKLIGYRSLSRNARFSIPSFINFMVEALCQLYNKCFKFDHLNYLHPSLGSEGLERVAAHAIR